MEAPPEKYSPPFWWFKRILLGYAVLIPLLVGTWFVWGWYANRVLDRQIASMRERGLPVTPADFDALQPVVAPAQNAALHYEAAEALCVWSAAENSWDASRTTNRIVTAADFAMAADVTATCQPALQEAYAGAELPVCRWSAAPSLILTGTFPRLGVARQLANTLELAAYHHHHIGEDAAALRDVRAILHLGRAQCQGSTLIEQLVGVAIEAIAPKVLMDILPDLSIGESAGQASAADVRAMIALLVNDPLAAEDRQRAFLGEAASVKAYVRYVPISAYTKMTPAFALYQARQSTLYVNLADGAVHEFFWEMHPLCDPAPPSNPSRSVGEYMAWLDDDGGLDFDINRAVVLELRSVVDQRMAGVAMAMRLCRVIHPQLRVAALADLVPEFLSEVPADPFARDHHVLRYQPAAPVARLYSVGDDGIDDGGSLLMKGGMPGERHRTTDLTFYLAPYVPPPL